MGAEYLLGWLRAFLLTQCVEMGVYTRATERRLRERLAIAFGASAMTHPLVWFVTPELVRLWRPTGHWPDDWWIGVAIAELFAVGAEALWLFLFGMRARAAIGWALTANLASFTFGLFIYRYLGW